MCDFRIDSAEIINDFAVTPETLNAILSQVDRAFAGHLRLDADGLAIPPEVRPLTRMIARKLDAYEMNAEGHSPAI